MKGFVFLEFIELVDKRFGASLVAELKEESQLDSGGNYLAAGTYPVTDMVTLVSLLADKTGLSVETLLKLYGEHLLFRLNRRYPEQFAGLTSSFELFRVLDSSIHVNVAKLYPDAELPKFHATDISAQSMELEYQSSRGLAALAEGLILGAAKFFGEQVTIEAESLTGDSTHVRFTLTLVE